MSDTAADPPEPPAAHEGRSAAPTHALTPTGDPVLAARFAVPHVPKTFVRRPRLLERLREGLASPLLLVGGPAGAGKTLLVADWVTSLPPGPTAWLTAERTDNAPGVFWAYVLEALRHHGSDLPDDIAGPASADQVDPALLARLAAWLSQQPEPVFLVLDEFDRVTSPQIASELQFVLRHASPGLRLALLSRTEPLLALHRYRAADQITEVRGADLAFSAQETAVLLRRHGLDLPAEGARALTARTEGWAAGLRLCALAAQRADDPESFLAQFEAGQSTIADFLLAEVLDTQPSGTQDLLLRTSILERTHPDLADALTGRHDAGRILAALQRANAFVEPIGHSWYRHHPLFAEILRVHLRARSPGLEPQLHRTAARWLSAADRLDDALPHAAAAGDWEFAAGRFVTRLEIGRLFTGLEADRLAELFARMPPDTPGTAPELVRAACALARYDIDGGLAHLHSAEEGLTDGDAETRLSHAFLSVLADGLLGRADPAEAAAEEAERLRRRVPAALLGQHPELAALLLTGLGSARLWAGRFDAACSALRTAAHTCAGPATAVSRHESLGRLGLVEFLRGSLRRAEAYARQAVGEAERFGLSTASRTGVAPLVLAAVAIGRDDLALARTQLDRAAASSGARHDPIAAAGLAVVGSQLLLAKGDPQAALRALDAIDRPVPALAPSPWVDEQVALAGSAAHLALGHPQAAVATLNATAADGPQRVAATASARLAAGEGEAARRILTALPTGTTGNGHGPVGAVRVLLARAQAAACLGDEAAAQRLLGCALVTARPERLRRPFLEAGPWLRRLLQQRPALAHAHDWLPAGLVGNASGEVPAPQEGEPGAVVVEPLSDREHEVLEYAAQMMSTEEIAAELHLSVNTVKTHLKSIYRKLSAGRRGEAVRRARQLHLL